MLAVCIPFDEGEQHGRNGTIIAISSGSPEGADSLYAKAVELGATCEHAPDNACLSFMTDMSAI